MQYIPEMQSFYERLESTPLSVYAIALWHALMHMNHKQDWSKEFKAASAALCFKSGLKVDMLAEARQELVQKGLLHYEDTDEGLAATYILCPLTDPADEPEANTESIGKGNTKNTEITEKNENIGSNRSQSTTRTKTDHRVNGDYTIKANLKKLDIHDKMLKKEWQQSVSIALTDIDVEDETLRGLQKYRPGQPVNIVIQSRKKQEKRKAHSHAKNRIKNKEEEIESMGPFESPPTGKEKVLQTFTF